MKKYSLSCLLLICLSIANAQSNRDSLSVSLQGNNEIKLNILYSILGSPEFTYERIITNKSSIGIAAFIRVFSPVGMDFNSGFTPYFRRYFGVKKASGFFLEAHGSVLAFDGASSGKPAAYIDSFGNTYFLVPKEKTMFGLGAAVGAKFLTKKGFTGEIYLGATKPFDKEDGDFIPRGGLTLGKRF
jgi:hypothetical protein